MVEPTARGRVHARDAVIAFAGALVAAEFVLRFVEFHEAADKQVEAAIVVVIEPHRTRCPSRTGDSGTRGDVSKRAVAVVVIENTSSILRHKKIGKAVTIVIADCDAHTVAAGSDSGALGHIAESAIAIVAIEDIAKRRLRIIEIALAAVDEVNVHPTVIVVVDEPAAGAGGLGEVV